MDKKIRHLVWKLKLGDEPEKLELWKLKNAAKNSFQHESDIYKQKLVYNLLEVAKNKDQNRFFYLLLKSINKPKENFNELWKKLKKNYDILPKEAFVDFAYSIIIGIMSTYSGGEKNE